MRCVSVVNLERENLVGNGAPNCTQIAEHFENFEICLLFSDYKAPHVLISNFLPANFFSGSY